MNNGEPDGADIPSFFEGLHGLDAETTRGSPAPATVEILDGMKPLYNRELLADPSH